MTALPFLSLDTNQGPDTPLLRLTPSSVMPSNTHAPRSHALLCYDTTSKPSNHAIHNDSVQDAPPPSIMPTTAKQTLIFCTPLHVTVSSYRYFLHTHSLLNLNCMFSHHLIDLFFLPSFVFSSSPHNNTIELPSTPKNIRRPIPAPLPSTHHYTTTTTPCTHSIHHSSTRHHS